GQQVGGRSYQLNCHPDLRSSESAGHGNAKWTSSNFSRPSNPTTKLLVSWCLRSQPVVNSVMGYRSLVVVGR
ncbi:MAG: hypothetical protein ACRD3J_04780, partial [Thermoanaerobaculia bacterium]